MLPRCYPEQFDRRRVSCKSLILLARPRGFEPLTFAFGGQFRRFAMVCSKLPKIEVMPIASLFFIDDLCPSLL